MRTDRLGWMIDSSTPSKVLSSPFSQFCRYPRGAKILVGKLQKSDSGCEAEREHILSWYLPYLDIPKCIVEGERETYPRIPFSKIKCI